jgi:Flp pilus assembly protein TadD
MKRPPGPAATPPTRPIPAWAAGALLVLLVWLAYANTLRAPFIFDDEPGIVLNQSIRQLWPLTSVLHPPAGAGVDGRPLLNLSLALNYATGGTAPAGYHAGNILIHSLAALLLFGLVRRTLARSGHAAADPLAWFIAALWALHPLQTESVTCVIQRTESLMGLFYLATLWAFVRSLDSPRAPAWQVASVTLCLAGMATKEVMVTAPLLVLLYDRTFAAGSFSAAWRQRRGYYLALAATWLLLALLVARSGGDRGGTAGWNSGISAWSYLLTQCSALVRYLRLSLVPYPLVLDYGSPVARGLSQVWPQAWLLTLLFAGSLWALGRRPWLGFCGAWFFLILAPSSSVVPLATQTMAEHRMYLALAAVLVPLALALHARFGRRTVWLGGALVLLSGVLTAARNHDYRSAAVIWQDSARHSPDAARSYYYLGGALAKEGRQAESIAAYREAVRLHPEHAGARNNLGNALARAGQPTEAVASLREALRLKPDLAEARGNLARLLRDLGHVAEGAGQLEEAGARYAEARQLEPGSPEIAADQGRLLMRQALLLWAQDRQAAGLAAMQEAARVNPADAVVHNTLGEALLQMGRPAEARREFTRALQLRPDYPAARANLDGLAR